MKAVKNNEHFKENQKSDLVEQEIDHVNDLDNDQVSELIDNVDLDEN